MLTTDDPKVQATEENQIEKIQNENENIREEIEITEKEIKTLNINKDTPKTENNKVDDDIVIPPPPEFSVPIFSKYIHGHQRSVSISSELSNDSYIYEETGANSPHLSIDTSGDTESINNEYSTEVQTPFDKKDLVDVQNVDTKIGNPSNINPKLLLLDDDDIMTTQEPEVKKKNPQSLTVDTDYNYLNTNNHIPPPRSSASLSASVTRQEGIHDEINEKYSAIKKAQDQEKEQKMEEPKRAKSFKEYFFAATNMNNNNNNNNLSNPTVEKEKPKKASSGSYLMSYVGSFLKKKNSYFETDEEFWDAFLKEYRKDAELDLTSQKTDGSNKFGDLLERVHRGVPAEHRGDIWLSISDSMDAHLDMLYWQLLNEHCPYERAINQDLGRTFPEIPLFKTEEVRKQLYNIMKAYSIYDSEVGYCQGLSFIAGLFIMQDIKEELVFTIFVRLMESYNLRTLFTPKMPGLMLLIYQFNAIFQTYIPALYFHFYRYNLSPMMYASQWFLTLFSYSFNVELVFRIVDMILVEGPISVLLRFALVVLKRHEDELLDIEKFDSLMNFLKSNKFTQVDDVEEMIKEVIDLKKIVSDNRLEQLKLEHLEDIKRREPVQREMEQLRETIKLLRKENKEQANKINEDKKIQQALTDEIVLLKQLVKELQEDNEAVKMQVKDLRIYISQEERVRQQDDRLITLQEELQFLKDKLRATQVELCQSRMQYNELETAYQLEQERWKKSKRRLSRKIQQNEDKSKRTSLIIDPNKIQGAPVTPTSMRPIDLPSIHE